MTYLPYIEIWICIMNGCCRFLYISLLDMIPCVIGPFLLSPPGKLLWSFFVFVCSDIVVLCLIWKVKFSSYSGCLFFIYFSKLVLNQSFKAGRWMRFSSVSGLMSES